MKILISTLLLSLNCNASFLDFVKAPAVFNVETPIAKFSKKVTASKEQYDFFRSSIVDIWNQNCKYWIEKHYMKGMTQLPRCANAIYPKSRPSIPVIIFGLYGTWLGNEFLNESKRRWDDYLNEPAEPEREGRPSYRRDLDHYTRPRIPGGITVLPNNGLGSGSSSYCSSEVEYVY